MRRWSHFLSYRCEALSVLNCPKCSITFLCTYWCMCVCLAMSWHLKDWTTDRLCINLLNANHLGILECLFYGICGELKFSLDVTIISWYRLLKCLCYIVVIKPWFFPYAMKCYISCSMWAVRLRRKIALIFFAFCINNLCYLIVDILPWKAFSWSFIIANWCLENKQSKGCLEGWEGGS